MNKYLKLFLHTAVALAVLLCLIPAPATASLVLRTQAGTKICCPIP